MRRILKFPVGLTATSIDTADRPTILALGWQGEQLVVWVEAEPGTEVRTVLRVALTGQQVPAGEYVGTAQHPTLNGGGPFVVHVYRDI